MLLSMNSVMKLSRKLWKLLFWLLLGRKCSMLNIVVIISVNIQKVRCVLFQWLVMLLFIECISVFSSGLMKVQVSGFMFGNWFFISIGKLVEKLMQELKVLMYNQYISQLCLWWKIIVCLENDEWVLVRLFMLNQVVMVYSVMVGIQMKLVFCRNSGVFFFIVGCGVLFSVLNMFMVMISGIIVCVIDMFILFRLVFRFSVRFCFCLGQKKEMLDIDDEKFVLLKLYRIVMVMNIQYGVVGFCIVKLSQSVGVSSEVVDSVVQWWLLKIGIMNEQKMCRVVLDRLGSVISQNSWLVLKLKLIFGRLIDIVENSIQIEKVSRSEGIEMIRLWVVICLLVCF